MYRWNGFANRRSSSMTIPVVCFFFGLASIYVTENKLEGTSRRFSHVSESLPVSYVSSNTGNEIDKAPFGYLTLFCSPRLSQLERTSRPISRGQDLSTT